MRTIIKAASGRGAAAAGRGDGARRGGCATSARTGPALARRPARWIPGHVQFELGLGDWTLTRQGGDREDDLATGDLLVRYGLTSSLEMQLGWTAYTHVRARSGNAVARMAAPATSPIALRQNLHNPDGSGFSIAIMPYATLPTGSDGIGAGDWGAGLLVPVTYAFPRPRLELTAEADAAVDADGRGRHLAYSAVFGMSDAGRQAGATAELSVARRGPCGHAPRRLPESPQQTGPRRQCPARRRHQYRARPGRPRTGVLFRGGPAVLMEFTSVTPAKLTRRPVLCTAQPAPGGVPYLVNGVPDQVRRRMTWSRWIPACAGMTC